MPDSVTGLYDLGASEFARQMAAFLPSSCVKIVGGCCGTSPEYIRELRAVFTSLKPVARARDTGREGLHIMQFESAEILRTEPLRPFPKPKHPRTS
jgi:5-methyltetrahydrofolate--homocysteine methyltransferase